MRHLNLGVRLMTEPMSSDDRTDEPSIVRATRKVGPDWG